jgi:hypothetical protein
MDPTKEQRICMAFCANLGKSATETLAMIRQAFTRVFEWHAQLRADGKKTRKMTRKFKSMFIILFDIRGIVQKRNCPGRPNSQLHGSVLTIIPKLHSTLLNVPSRYGTAIE